MPRFFYLFISYNILKGENIAHYRHYKAVTARQRIYPLIPLMLKYHCKKSGLKAKTSINQ